MMWITVLSALALATQLPGNGAVTVGDGTPASCTDAGLDDGLSQLQDGDTLNFNCGTEAHTITLSSPKWTEKSVTIDGGDKITLHGQDKYRHFIFNKVDTFRGMFATNMDVTVKNIKLVHGFGNAINTGRRVAKGVVEMDNPVPKHDGGSIYMGKRGTLRLSHVTITDSKTWGKPILEDDIDQRNLVTFRGGGVYIGVECTGIFEDCVFERNVARMEGGAVHARWQTVELIIRRSMFYKNEAFDEAKNNGGGAIFVQETFFKCEYCYFRENHAQTGGAIRNLMAETTLRHCIFSKNGADKKTTLMKDLLKPIKGGAFYVDGARTLATGAASSKIVLSNCTFEENHAEKGGGVYLCLYEADSAVIENSRFCNNWVNNTENYVFPTGAGLQRDCVGNFTLKGSQMGGNLVTGRDFRMTASETYNDSPENGIFSNNTIPGWPNPHNTVIDPPGPSCKLEFCDAFPEYCDDEEPAPTEPPDVEDCDNQTWTTWSECTRPCGGCGTQRQQKTCPRHPIGVVYQYRVCNVCPCRVGTDPELFTFNYNTKSGRMIQKVMDAPCCFKYDGESTVHQLSGVDTCLNPLVDGWYNGTYDRETYCETGLLHDGIGPDYIGF